MAESRRLRKTIMELTEDIDTGRLRRDGTTADMVRDITEAGERLINQATETFAGVTDGEDSPLSRLLEEWSGAFTALDLAAEKLRGGKTKRREKAADAAPAVTGIARITVPLAEGINAAVTILDDKGRKPRHLSKNAITASIYLARLLPKRGKAVDRLTSAPNTPVTLTATYQNIELNAREVGAFAKFMFGGNTAYTRRELAETLAELARPVTTSFEYGDPNGYNVSEEIGNARLIDVKPRRITGKVGGKVVYEEDGIIISVCKLFYLDVRHYAAVDVQKWGAHAREKNGNVYVGVRQALLPKAPQVAKAEQNGGTVVYKYSDSPEYEALSKQHQYKYRTRCREVAKAIAEDIGAGGYKVGRDGISFTWKKPKKNIGGGEKEGENAEK